MSAGPRVPPAVIGGGMLLLLGLVVLVFYLTRPGQSSAPRPPSASNEAQIFAQLTNLSPGLLDQVGLGSISTSKVTALSEPALNSGGKPEILFVGAEYCPYCAAQRWPLIIALSRFGSLSGVSTMTSSSSDVYPDTPTWTFRHATYTSQYIAFVPVEVADRDGNALQQPTSVQSALVDKYGSGTVPFTDFGNRLYLSGATYFPTDLQGLTWQQIANDLQNPQSSQAQEILGSANLLTAAICRATGDGPASVCSNPVIQRIEASLPKPS